MGFIYKITNLLNNKEYIGQTTLSTEIRFKQHIYNAVNLKRDCAIDRAINKYGRENFVVKTICEINDCYLDYAEKFYISKFNTLRPHGYNVSTGGKGNSKLNFEEIEQLYSCGLSNKEIASLLGYNAGWLSTKLTSRGYKRDLKQYFGSKCSKYSLDGEYIESFKSLRDTARSVNGQHRPISLCCKGIRHSAYGYMWKFTDGTES